MTASARRRTRRQHSARMGDGLASMAATLSARQDQLVYRRGKSLTDDRAQLVAMWLEDWIARKICDRKSRDMTRRWREVKANSLPADKIDAFQRMERRLRVREVFRQACQWASLFGTGAVLVITDVDDVAHPMAKGETVQRLIAVDRPALSAEGGQTTDVMSANFGMPEFYRVKGSSRIHHSRMILIRGGEKPLSEPDYQWGTTDLEPVYRAMRRFDLLSLNIGELVGESKIDIFKMEGLSHKITSGLEENVLEVVAAVQRIKSITNSLLLDKDADHEQKELTFTGLRDLLVEFRNAVAGAADMPVTILFGQSASGFASGKEDLDSYYDSINGLQESRLRPALDRLDAILAQQVLGQDLPDDWWYEFPSLRVLTEVERVSSFETFARGAATLLTNGVLREDQVASELKQSSFFDNVSDKDVEELKRNGGAMPGTGKDPYGFSPTASAERKEAPAQPPREADNAV